MISTGMETPRNNILSDFLEQLGVPYTPGYADARFEAMPFKSLFGLQQVLKEYGVESRGLQLADTADAARLTPPFIARTKPGLVIVTAIDPEADTLRYMSQGVEEKMSLRDFTAAWDGMAFVAYPTAESAEPDYAAHRRDILMVKAHNIGIVAGLVFLFAYLFISNGIWRHWSTVLLTLLDLAGLYLTYMLVQKSLKIHNAAADKVCKVLQEGGCDSVLEMKASKFFGIFGWSEVGFSYFSVSLLTLLIFPQWTGYLALCNLCCLPYTFWSIWYQKFRAKVWCTLCVSVQSTLWLLFFCYLGGGWFGEILPLRFELLVLGACYLTTLLILNRILPYFSRKQ